MSFLIKYEFEGFDTSAESPRRMYCTWSQLMKAAITVGRRDWQAVIKDGEYSLHEILYRMALVRANLHQQTLNPSSIPATLPELTQTDALGGLDPTEKHSISFYLA